MKINLILFNNISGDYITTYTSDEIIPNIGDILEINSAYETIIVLGHVEEYRKFYNSKIGKFKIGKDSTGNFGSCIKFI